MDEDVDLLAYVVWAPDPVRTISDFRETMRGVRRLIDFDGTIAVLGTMAPQIGIRGTALADFLAEEPYVVQTWNPASAIRFFIEHPQLPQPRLIMVAPMHDVIGGDGRLTIGKDFTPLGVSDAVIIDDMPAESIRAPGCVILSP